MFTYSYRLDPARMLPPAGTLNYNPAQGPAWCEFLPGSLLLTSRPRLTPEQGGAETKLLTSP